MRSRPGMRWRVTTLRSTAAYDQPRPAAMAPQRPKKWRTPANRAKGITVLSISFGSAWRASVRRRGISNVADIWALLGNTTTSVEPQRTNCDLRPTRDGTRTERAGANEGEETRDDPPMSARAVVLDFFGTLARATTSVGIDEILARHGHSISEQLQEMWWSGD